MPNHLSTQAPLWPNQRCAFQMTKAEMEAILPDRVIAVDIDIPVAAQVVLNRVPGIRALRSAIASSLADFDMRSIDRLELYVRSMYYTHWLYQSTRMSADRLGRWFDEWPALHARLVAEANRLLSSRMLDNTSFGHCPNPRRCLDSLTTAQRLCCLFNLNWARIEGTIRLRLDEVARAEVLAEVAAIIETHGDDLRNIESVLTWNRLRAFTLFLTNYDQVRRAMQFIRWSVGDADTIAPALTRRAVRRRLGSCPPSSFRYSIASMDSPLTLHRYERNESA